MATKQVTWTSRTRLSCAGCLPADIVLCVPADIVETTPHTTINATLTVVTPISDSCGQTLWKYVATYDDSQLVEDANLLGSQITGAFCKGCLTQWVLDQVSNANGPYQAPTRVNGGAYQPSVGTVPTDGQTGGDITLSYTNNTDFNVSFLPFIEAPTVYFDMVDGNEWSVEMTITPSWTAGNTPQIAHLRCNGPTSLAQILGGMFTTFPGPTTVAPGDTVTIDLQWTFNRIAFVSDASNQVEIFGPRASFVAHAI